MNEPLVACAGAVYSPAQLPIVVHGWWPGPVLLNRNRTIRARGANWLPLRGDVRAVVQQALFPINSVY